MSPFLRKVKTASGATAVQIVEKRRGQRRILEHLGSAHTDAELAAFARAGPSPLQADDQRLCQRQWAELFKGVGADGGLAMRITGSVPVR